MAQATGEGTRTGRPTNARRLRQTARRMFALIDRELADRHQATLLRRESRFADAETYLALHDNGNGTFSGKFAIPELHGHLLRDALDRLTSPRRLARDRPAHLVVDETVDRAPSACLDTNTTASGSASSSSTSPPSATARTAPPCSSPSP